MKSRREIAWLFVLPLTFVGTTMVVATLAAEAADVKPARPQGPCDIYAAAGTPCVAAHSTTRALFATYNGPLYQVLRQSDGKTLDIGVVKPSGSDAGGYANAPAQDAFCADTTCWISILYDQSGTHNHLIQPPRGAFSGPALGGSNNMPLADMAPITIMGHKAYGVFIVPGMGLRLNDAKATAVDDQAEGQYWVIDGHHYNDGCCYDYGNGEIDSRDDGNGTMETTYFGNAWPWFRGNPPGPWIMTDQENNLVGCVNENKSKLCSSLQSVTWRFVTAMAKGKPHQWASLGGDAQKGALDILYDGRRIDVTYDPMRKQGAIVLGNGGDNSHGSQGTFYEGAMTAAGTYPSHAVDQAVQANVVAAKYDVPQLALAPTANAATPPGLQSFTPGSSQEVLATFTNTTGAPVSDLTLALSPPKGWKGTVAGSSQPTKHFKSVAPGETAQATFKVTSGMTAFNGDLVAKAQWSGTRKGEGVSAFASEKVRNTSPIKINEFRVSDGSANTSDSFIELYNAGDKAVDISGWSLTEHAAQDPIFSTIGVPAGTKLAPKSFYLLGLANSGLAVPAKAGDTSVHVRTTAGMKVGDTLAVGSGADAETHVIAKLGSAAGGATTLWQPLPEGPVITIPAGSTNVPVASTGGFKVGEKIALGYGTTYPAVARDIEKYEVATVTAVGKPGTQAYLAADVPVGATNIKVTSVANISLGDQIRLDIDSVGHGIEWVTVKSVGSAGSRTVLAEPVKAGARDVKLRSANGIAVGDTLNIGMPSNRQTVTVTTIAAEPGRATVTFTPVLTQDHIADEDAVAPGTGLELTQPLKFAHADNLPFSARGTGISFAPATAFAHSSNEPVQPLGTGITLNTALTKDHAIHAVVHDTSVTVAGYQGPKPQQWFGGPALSGWGGTMVLRDKAGNVADSLNYGLLADPWASEGYQAVSGAGKNGCFVQLASNNSAGRLPDGFDSDSNCTDFRTPITTTVPNGSAADANDMKVASVAGFSVGQTVSVDVGASREIGVIAKVGTPGASTVATASEAGSKILRLGNAKGFASGQAITIDGGATFEQAIVASANPRWSGGGSITLSAPLKFAHAVGAQVSGTGITLAAPLAKAHAPAAGVTSDPATPGAPNKYSRPQSHL